MKNSFAKMITDKELNEAMERLNSSAQSITEMRTEYAEDPAEPYYEGLELEDDYACYEDIEESWEHGYLAGVRSCLNALGIKTVYNENLKEFHAYKMD